MVKFNRRRSSFRRSRKSFRRKGRRFMKRNIMTASRVRRIIDAELKYNVISVGPIEVPITAGIVIPITSGIAQGFGITQRIGNWITPRNIHGNLVVKGNQAAMIGTDSFLLRAGIFQWKNDEQFDSPDVNQIVQDPLAPLGPLNFANRGSFKQVWGRTFIIMNDDDNSKFIMKFPIYIRLRPRKTLYDDGNPKKFNYFFFIHSDSIVADNPVFNLDLTVRYNDS